MNDNPKFIEIENEIDKMDINELLYVRMAPQTYINKKFEKELKESENYIKEIELNNNSIKRNEQVVNNQKALIVNECNKLKMEIEQSKDRINKLILQKSQLNKQPTKANFINKLDNEIKKSFKSPDVYFREFLSKKISQSEFLENLRKCGMGKNYYYYKVLSDKLKEM